MSFELAQVQLSESAFKVEYPVALTLRKTEGYPYLHITLTGEFAESAGIVADEKYEFYIGKGADRGKILLQRDERGRFFSRPHGSGRGITFCCGRVSKLGMQPRPRERCEARIAGPSKIEITLPKWSKAIRQYRPREPQLVVDNDRREQTSMLPKSAAR